MAAADESKRRRRAAILLVLGMAAGAGMAAWGLTTGERGGLPADLVARVNGQPIRSDEYERLLAALDADRRAPIDDAARRHVLDRLIDEELLVQRGLDLGLVRRDRRLRAGVTGAVIASVVGAPGQDEITDKQLQAFYEENGAFFRRTGRLRVRQIFIRADGDGASSRSLDRAREAARRWRAGEDFASLSAALGDAPLAPLPDALLPAAKLRDYLGPTVARAALELGGGEISEPIRSGGGFHVVQVVERDDGTLAPFAEVREQVRAEYRRRADERALRAYLDDLRRDAEIVVADELR
jgi:parvulin-like peptidyl-prolyl isomerase